MTNDVRTAPDQQQPDRLDAAVVLRARVESKRVLVRELSLARSAACRTAEELHAQLEREVESLDRCLLELRFLEVHEMNAPASPAHP